MFRHACMHVDCFKESQGRDAMQTSGQTLEGGRSLEACHGGSMPQEGDERPEASLPDCRIHQLWPVHVNKHLSTRLFFETDLYFTIASNRFQVLTMPLPKAALWLKRLQNKAH